MLILTNKRHEAFLQGIASGLRTKQAYTEAAYNENRSENALTGIHLSANC